MAVEAEPLERHRVVAQQVGELGRRAGSAAPDAEPRHERGTLLEPDHAEARRGARPAAARASSRLGLVQQGLLVEQAGAQVAAQQVGRGPAAGRSWR